MVNIGELLGRGEIANLFSETVEEGEVYRLRLSINSEINPYLPACRKELHYLLKATDYDFWKVRIALSIVPISRKFPKSALPICSLLKSRREKSISKM